MARRFRIVALVFAVTGPLTAEAQTEADQIRGLVNSVSESVRQRQAEADEKQAQVDLQIQELQRQFDTNDPAQRQRAINSIVSFRDPRFAPVITELLKDPSAYNRRSAIYALYQMQARSAAEKIGALVSADPDSQVQHYAAEYGTRLGYRSSMKEIGTFLARPDPASQSVALHLSNSLPDQQEVDLLAVFLDHKLTHLRVRAVLRLLRHDPKLIKRHVMKVLRLAGDANRDVQRAVQRNERLLRELATAEDLRKLTEAEAPPVKAMAYRMLRERGEDTTAALTSYLSSQNKDLRAEAMLTFRAAGKGPEKEIVALLDDPDPRVKSYALSAMPVLRFRSAVPKLRKIFATETRYNRKLAAEALVAMNESVWGPAELPAVEGAIFGAVAKLHKGDDEAAWKDVIAGCDEIVNELAKLAAFPCDRDSMLRGQHTKRFKVLTQGAGRISERRCIGGNTPHRVDEAVLVHHGDLIVKGSIRKAIVIVTGNLYMHDGYVNDSTVIVQGNFVCGGYISNSVVITGEGNSLRILDSHVGQSIIAAGTIETDGSYTSESIYCGTMLSGSDNRVDLRNSSPFDAASIYRRLKE